VGGFIDLHSHWVADVDDGVRSHADGGSLLAELAAIGFERVVATPHMRIGMFDNEAEGLRRAFERTTEALGYGEERRPRGLPAIGLASEHFLDDVVFERLATGRGLPFPGGHAALVELSPRGFPARLAERLVDLRRRGLRAVIAHPERYETVWKDREVLEPLLDAGAVLQLDVASLVGKYGRAPQRAAEALLEEGWYTLAASDAHKPKDVDEVARAIERIAELAGDDEVDFLLREGPRAVLEGRLDEL
jgi:protein-tyrosine phosphatase